MKIKLKGISHEEKVGQSGKQYTSCKLRVWSQKDGKDIFISGFGNDITRTWQAGDEVDVDLNQTDKGYWNFDQNKDTKPSKTALDVLKEISAKLDKLLPKQPEPAFELPEKRTLTPEEEEEISQMFGK